MLHPPQVTTARQPPLAKGQPILGSALAFKANPLQFLVQQYLQLGPIFDVKAANRRFTVLAGPEANLFVTRHGNELLHSADFWEPFASELPTDHFLGAIDGELHSQMRKIVKQPYSREVILSNLSETVDMTKRAMDDWHPGSVVPVTQFMKRLIADQIGMLVLNAGPGDYFPDFVSFMRIMLNVVLGQSPRIAFKLPPYQRAKSRIMQLAQRIIDEHNSTPLEGREADLVDYFIQAQREHPELVSRPDMLIGVVGPYLAGIDTAAGTCAFMLYALLENPDVLERLTAEVDSVFADGTLTAEKLRAMPLLHAAATETLRMYPVAPMVQRTASKGFEFNGCGVEKGATVMVGTCVAHYAPSVYLNPEKFDVERCMSPRNEHRKPGAFAPYGYGSHTCAGAGLAEVEIMVTLATLLHMVQVEKSSSNYTLRVAYDPSPAPSDDFKIRILNRRH